MIVLVLGLPGSGKTFFAEKIASEIGASHISSDVIRMNLFESRRYSEEEKLLVYDEMLKQMKAKLSSGLNVVLDATFYKASIRMKFIDEAKKRGESIFIIQLKAEEELIKERISEKRKNSEADYLVYKRVKSEFEEISEDHLELVSTNENIEVLIDEGINYMGLNDK